MLTHLIALPRLQAAMRLVVRGFGSREAEVEAVADNLIEANLTGHDSHGIGMLPRYAEACLEGGLKPNSHVSTVLDGGALLRLDGNAGFGQVIGQEAIALGIERTRQHGCCVVALGNAHHLGRIGAWAEQAAQAGLVSLHFVNVIARGIVAPFGGSDETGLHDAIRWGTGTIEKRPVVVAVMDFAFIRGSMGSVVGEKIARAVDKAWKSKGPLIIVSSSGGARMMEGALSLMQLAKTSSRLARLADAGVPYLSILTDPTTGGVTASYAMLGDVNIAEPGALIGFAGPRVIRQTIGKDLPPGFQRSEFQLEHGFVDTVVDRKEMRQTVSRLLALLA